MAIDLYKEQLKAILPSKKVKYYQIYNASEGCFAVQNENDADDMLLLTNHGVFYEFLELKDYNNKDMNKAMGLEKVETGKDYVILITTNSGLRRYVLGDTIQFTSTNPYKIEISGRTKYYIDVVGECVTADYRESG